MKIFKDYIDSGMIDWLEKNNLKYKVANIKLEKGSLINIFNDNFCIKIYDRLGHGFGVNINVADKYDESLYDNDNFNLFWAFKYFKITQSASFSDRSKSQYSNNLSNLIDDLKNIIPRLNELTSQGWNDLKEWISREALKQFSVK